MFSFLHTLLLQIILLPCDAANEGDAATSKDLTESSPTVAYCIMYAELQNTSSFGHKSTPIESFAMKNTFKI